MPTLVAHLDLAASPSISETTKVSMGQRVQENSSMGSLSNFSGSSRMPVKSVKLGDNGKYACDNISKKIHPWVHSQNYSRSGRMTVKIKQNEQQFVTMSN